MVTVFGNLIFKVKLINTRVLILTIKNVDMENLYGQMELCIKEIISMIKGKAMGKCIKMELSFIKENGIEVCK